MPKASGPTCPTCKLPSAAGVSCPVCTAKGVETHFDSQPCLGEHYWAHSEEDRAKHPREWPQSGT
jgi:hypothetical protein